MPKTKHSLTQPKQPHVGIFWWWRNHLLADSMPLADGIAFGGVVQGPRDHVNVWPRFQRLFPELLDTDYIDVPRGRVLYQQAEKKCVVYLDRKLATAKVKEAVRTEFALPRRATRFEFDPHYTTDHAALERMFGED